MYVYTTFQVRLQQKDIYTFTLFHSTTTNIIPESDMDVARTDGDGAFPSKHEAPLELRLYRCQLPVTAKIHVIHFKNHAGLHMYS